MQHPALPSITQYLFKAFLFLALSGLSYNTFSQAPNITYTTPQTYLINKPIAALSPNNTGGAVPATIYGQVSTVPSSFSTLTAVATDNAGNIYVTDYGTNQVRKISSTGIITLLAGNISALSGSADGQGTAASFYFPDGLVIDAAGNLYVGDLENNLIRKITPSGLVTTLAGSGVSGSANGMGNSANFNYPRGLAIDAQGNIYVADQGNNLIRKITPAGVVTTYAGNGTAGFTNGTSTSASFNTPTGLGFDAAGNLYVADSGNGAIRKITVSGTVTTFATGFNTPRDVRADGTGNLYVSEQYGEVIKRISAAGVVTVIAGTGQAGYKDGAGNTAMFNLPIGIVLDGNGNLYLADQYYLRKVIISGYTIDKALPAGLLFDLKTGVISGIPTVLWPATNYTITAYNGGGSSTTAINIQVLTIKPSIITLPPPVNKFDANNNYDPGATSTNTETPITYTSSNPAVAIVTPDGIIHAIAPGYSQITAHQSGNSNYADAAPVTQTLTVTEYLYVELPLIDAKTTCSGDFNSSAINYDPVLPVTYTSSNPAVATISTNGTVHVISTGTTIITASQVGNPPLYVAAVPKSQTLTVTLPVLPSVSIAATYSGPCAGSPITFMATPANGGINSGYQWQVNGAKAGSNSSLFTSSTLADGDKVTCIITNNDAPCLATYPSTSNVVTVKSITPTYPIVTITASTDRVFPGTPITFTATVKNPNGFINYQWYVNGNNAGSNGPTFTSDAFINGDVVACTITPEASCSAPANSQPLTVIIVVKLTIPNSFTPNGDGVNDVWNISGIASYPACLVNIYNRLGTIIYSSKGYPTAWDGTFNGAPVPVGTYYYLITGIALQEKLGGSITIIR